MALIGWSVIHAWWWSTLAGVAVVTWMAWRPSVRPDLRCRVGLMALALMAMGPIVIAALQLDPMPRVARATATSTVNDVIGFSAFVAARRVGVPLVGWLWLGGVSIGLWRLVRQWQRLSQYERTAVPAPEAEQRMVAELAAALNISQPVRLCYSRACAIPMVFGWRLPTILLPANIHDVLPAAQLRGVLQHELAHIRRHDFPINLWQVGLDILLWFHPAARWVSRQVRADREFSCDDMALASGTDTATYAHALAALDDARDEGRLAIAAGSGTLLSRLERLAGRSRRLLSPTAGAVVILAALLVSAAAFAAALLVPPAVELNAQLRQRTPGPTAPMR